MLHGATLDKAVLESKNLCFRSGCGSGLLLVLDPDPNLNPGLNPDSNPDLDQDQALTSENNDSFIR
jgi:hypothetical protein